jgi:hypothetical protein
MIFFSDFSDGNLDSKNYKFKLNEKNENFFEVIISCSKPEDSSYAIDKIQNIIDLNKSESELLGYIRSSLMGLEDNSEVEKIKFDSYSRGTFNIKIWTKVKGDIENWFTITEDGYFEMDESRLKILMKEKFGIDVLRSRESNDVDNQGEPYREIVIETNTIFNDNRDLSINILNYFRSIRRNYWQMERRVFTRVVFDRMSVYLDLDPSLSFD